MMRQAEELEARIEALEHQTDDVLQQLLSRIKDLKNGNPTTDNLIDAVADIVDRYIFIAAYASINRDRPDWGQLANELLAAEGDVLLLQPDPDIRAAYEVSCDLERAYRASREAK